MSKRRKEKRRSQKQDIDLFYPKMFIANKTRYPFEATADLHRTQMNVPIRDMQAAPKMKQALSTKEEVKQTSRV